MHAAVHRVGPTLRVVPVLSQVPTSQRTELPHDKCLSENSTSKNSAILFSNYINNSKFVLFKFALGLHTCVCMYILNVLHIRKPTRIKQNVPRESWHLNKCLFLFLQLNDT